MELWVRSQDKTRLVKVCSLEYGEYNEKHYINGYCVNEVDNYDLGTYKTEERALEVLDEIESILCYKRLEQYSGYSIINVENNVAVYEMPKE